MFNLSVSSTYFLYHTYFQPLVSSSFDLNCPPVNANIRMMQLTSHSWQIGEEG